MSRPTRDRKSIRPSLNENALILDASQGDADAAEEYKLPKRRVSKQTKTDADEGEGEEEEEADDQEVKGKKKARKPRAKKAAPAAGDADAAEEAGEGGGGAAVGKKSKAQQAAELLEVDRAELVSQIYQHLAHTNSSAGAIGHEILTQYSDPRKSARATLGIINFILNACGCTKVIKADDLELDVAALVQQASDVSHQSSIEPPMTRVKTFSARWVDFWTKFTAAADAGGQLYDDVLFPDTILSWLRSCSGSPVRVWRQLCTTGAFAILAQLNAICVGLRERSDLLDRQMADPAIVKTKKKAIELKQEADAVGDKIDYIETSLLKAILDNVFIHRYRDVDATIREQCIGDLGQWLLAYPAYWLSDTHTKYVMWMLNDKSERVRFQAVEAALALMRQKDPVVLEKCGRFASRFAKRFMQMTGDVDPDVSASAIELLAHLLEQGHLNENDGESIGTLLWDDSLTVRERAAKFVFADVFADGLDEKKSQEDLAQLMNVLDKYCPMTDTESVRRGAEVVGDQLRHGLSTSLDRPMDTLINVFWSSLPALQDYDAQSKLLQKLARPTTSEKGVGSRKKAAPVDEDRQLTLCYLIASVAKRASGQMEGEGVPTLAATKKKADREAMIEEWQKFSAHFVTVLGDLLSLFQQDVAKLKVLLTLVPRVDLTLYGVLRKGAEFAGLLKRLASIYKKHSDDGLLEECAHALRYLSETEHQFRDQATAACSELAAELARDWATCYERVHGSEIDVEMDSEEKLAAMQVTLKRMLCLQRSLRLSELAWDALPSLEKSLAFYALNHAEPAEQAVLVTLMHLGFASLAWNVSKLQQEAKEEEGAAAGEEEPEEEEEGKEEEDSMEVDEEKKESSSSSKKKKKKAPAKKAASKRSSKRGGASSKYAGARAQKATAHLLQQTHALETSYLSYLEQAILSTDASAVGVRDTVYRLLADLFLMFSGKLHGTSLASLTIGPDRLRQLQTAFNSYFTTLMDGPDLKWRVPRSASDRARQAFFADQRVLAVRDAVKVALYDMNSTHGQEGLRTTLRHKELAGLLLARLGSMGDEVDAFLKMFQSGLKQVSTNTLLQAQFAALERCFAEEVPESDLKALALKFTQSHAVNPQQRSFAAFLTHGMMYALTQVPTRLKFLDLLVPFILRANMDDLKHATRVFRVYGTRALEAIEPEDREGDEWEAIRVFADAVNKKFQALVLDVQERAVAIEAAAASKIPATPARSKKAGRGEEDEGVLGALTPMGSPGSRKRSTGTPPSSSKSRRAGGASRGGRKSELGTVEEATGAGGDEEEESEEADKKKGRKAKSAGGKKRSHAAVEEEGEEEEEAAAEEERQEPQEDAEEEGGDEESMDIDEGAPAAKKKGKGKKAAAAASKRGRKRAAE